MSEETKRIWGADKQLVADWFGGTNEAAEQASSEASLDLVFQGATGVRLFAGGVSGGKPRGSTVLLEIDEQEDIAQLRECLHTTATGFHCMCTGSFAIEVSGPEGIRDVIGLHHGRSIRWRGFSSDAQLLDGRKLLEWFAARGAEEPLRQYEAHEEYMRAVREKMA